MSATSVKKRKSRKGISINIPNWQDRLTSLTRLLREKSEANKSRLRMNSSVEDIVQVAVSELEAKKEQLKSLETQYQQLQSRALTTTTNKRSDPSADSPSLNSWSSGDSAFSSPISPSSESTYTGLSQNYVAKPLQQPTFTVSFPLLYPPRSILHRDGFYNAPMPFFTMTAALLIVDCNDAFVQSLFRFGVPPSWNAALCSREAILKNNVTLVDIVSAFCSSKLKDLSQGIVATMMAGHVIVRDDRVICHNGVEASTDSSLWTTYDESDEFRRPLYVNCLQLSSRLLTPPPEPFTASVIL